MPVNLSARPYKIVIAKPTEDGSTGLDVTDACSGESGGYFACNDAPVTEKGLMLTKGELVLVPPASWRGESFNPWVNGSRWAIGNRVFIYVANESGTLLDHPRSRLYIISEPEPPHAGNPTLTLELGCWLTYNDAAPSEPDEDLSLDTQSNRTDIITRQTEKLGGSFVGAIAGGATPIKWFPVNPGEKLTEQMGGVAIADRNFLWTAKNGSVYAQYINLFPATRLFKQTVGVDDAGGFVPLQGAKRPPTKVRAIGSNWTPGDPASNGSDQNGSAADPDNLASDDQGATEDDKPRKESGSDRYVEYVAKETVQEGAGAEEVEGVVTNETWQWQGNTFIRTLRVDKLRGLILPDDFYEAVGRSGSGGSPFRLTNAELTTETRYYDSGPEGKIQKEIVTSYINKGTLFQQFWRNNPPPSSVVNPDFLGLITGYRKVTIYNYGGDGQLESQISKTYRPRGEIAANADDWGDYPWAIEPLVLAESASNLQQETNRGEWKKRESVQRAGRVQSGGIQAFLSLGTVTARSRQERTGETQPPAPDRRLPKETVQEKVIQATANFANPTGGTADGGDRTATYRFPYANSNAQLARLAQLMGSLDNARHRGFRIVSRWRDEFFSYTPMSRVDVSWDGYEWIGISDSVTWTMARNQISVVFDCARVGIALTPYPSSPDPDPVAVTTQSVQPTTTVKVEFRGAIAIGGNMGSRNYAVGSSATSEMRGAIAIGGRMAQSFRGAIGIGGEFGGVGTGFEATLNLNLSGTNLSGSEIWVYYSATELTPDPFAVDLSALPRQVYEHGTDYTSTLDISAFLGIHGLGHYHIALYQPAVDADNFLEATPAYSNELPDLADWYSQYCWDPTNLPAASNLGKIVAIAIVSSTTADYSADIEL